MRAWGTDDDRGDRTAALLAVLDGIDDGILVLDGRARVQASNLRFSEITGFARDEVVGARPPHPWWPTTGGEERLTYFDDVVAGDADPTPRQVVFQRPDGQLVQVEGRVRRAPGLDDTWVVSYRETTAAQAEAQRVAAVFETMSDSVVRVSPKGVLTFVSDGAARYAGLPADELMGGDMTRFLHPDDGPAIAESFMAALQGRTNRADYRFISATGMEYCFAATAAPIYDLRGEVAEVQVLSRDITDRVRREEMDAAVLAVISAEANDEGRDALERVVASAAAGLVGGARAAVVHMDGSVPAVVMHPAHAGAPPAWTALAERALDAGEPCEQAYDAGRAIAVPVPITHGAPTAVVVLGTRPGPACAERLQAFAGRIGIALDAADSLERLRTMADTDGLTGLLNRRAFDAALRLALDDVRGGAAVALAIADLDGLKAINDAHGHAAGDEALAHVAASMQSVARHDDRLARLGGDEFAWLLHDTSQSDAEAAAVRLRGAVTRVSEAGARISASIGITVLRPDDDPDTALRRADAMLYREKAPSLDGDAAMEAAP